MDTSRLKYYCVIVETGSMRKAAELLRLSPSALSKAMRLLEGEAGGRQLLIASGRGVTITDEGRKAYEKARLVLKAVDDFGKESPSENYEKPLRIGSFEIFTTHFFGRLMNDYYPDLSLILHELLPGQMEEGLLKQQIDIALTYLPVPRPELDYLEVTRVESSVFSSKKPKFSTDVFSEIPFIIPVPPLSGSTTKVRGMDGWPDDSIPRKAKYQVTMLETALALCRNGLGAAYLPNFVVKLHNESVKITHQLVELRAPKKVRTINPVYLVKRRTDTENSTMRNLAKAIRAICSE